MTRESVRRLRSRLYKEVVLDDSYGLCHIAPDSLDVVLDIGANVGLFCTLAALRQRSARIYAFEPFAETYELLVASIAGFSSIKAVQKALGPAGRLLYSHMHSRHSLGDTIFTEEPHDRTSLEVGTLSISQIVTEFEIDLDKRCFFKCDCEGGERFLLDSESTSLLRQFCYLGIEVHFRPQSDRESVFQKFPEWGEYDSWIRDSFSRSHRILYHKSRRRSGLGTYVLTPRGESIA